MTESVALALFGGALGLALAPLASRGLTALLAHGGWRAAAPTLDWRVLAFTFAVSLATGLVFGLAPALRCTRLRLDQAVKHGAMPAAGRLHTDKILAVAQTALSLLLLVGAGLLVRTLVNLERQPLGFDPAQVLTFSLDARQAGYAEPALAGFYLGLQARLASLPGVAAAGVSQHSLLGGDMGGDAVRVPSSASPLQWRSSMSNGVGPGFFAALRIPILRGRAIDAEDVQAAKPVAVISTAMARAYFGAADPVGRLVLRRDSISASTAFTVVGVAGDARYVTLKGPFPPTYYIPYTRLQSPVDDLTFELRSAAPPARRGTRAADALGPAPTKFLPAIRRAVHDAEPGLALENVETQAARDLTTLGSQRLLAHLGAAFAVLGLLLAGVGIEGTMAHAVVCRTRDIGIRMALGADRGRISRAILTEALAVAAAGTALGAALSLLAVRWIASHLYGVHPLDPITFAAAALILLAIATLAAWLPARRAAGVDPMLALRCD